MIKNFWYSNRQFLLFCGSALVIFLLLDSCVVSGYFDSATEAERRGVHTREEILQLHTELKDGYWLEVKRAETYEAHEKLLREELCLRPATVGESGSPGDLMVQLDEEIDKAWGAVQVAASQKGIALPQKLTTQGDFEVRRDDGPEEYRSYLAYLHVVRQALRALVDAGVTQFSKPSLQEPEFYPVLENEDLYCLYRPVRFQVAGPYESFLRVLEKAQESGKFLQVRLFNLHPASSRSGGSGADGLRAVVEFVGLEFEQVAASEGDASRDVRSRRRRR